MDDGLAAVTMHVGSSTTQRIVAVGEKPITKRAQSSCR